MGDQKRHNNTEGEASVAYIGHSGFCVRLGKLVLLFDYYKGEIPEFDPDSQLYVFASHRHQDHFNFEIFNLYGRYREVHYILSWDIGRKYKAKYLQQKRGVSPECCKAIHWMKPEEEFSDGWIRVRTLPSTDEGVAFLVKEQKGQKTIYHAGDLNWWTWEGETRRKYEKRTEDFQSAVAQLEGEKIDIAFLPLDPRQGKERFWLGFDYVMRHVSIRQAYPMHCWDDFRVIDQLKAMECSSGYRDKIVSPIDPLSMS